MNNKISHKLTKFDLICEENKEYSKEYNSSLSYGYYTLYKETGKLPSAWYEHLIDIQKNMPKDIDMDSLEYQEYKRRFYRRLSFIEYLNKRDNGRLPKRWYQYLIENAKRIPENFSLAYAEYCEYIQMFNEKLSFYEYYERKDNGKLPVEWYQFLIRLEKTIFELETMSEI